MYNRIRTRDTKTDSVNSVSKDKIMGVEIQSTSKPLTYTNVRDTVDQYEQYMKERGECTKHRLILTLTPYCSNVLFNPLTEIVFHEGDEDNAIAASTSGVKFKEETAKKVYGHKEPNRQTMIDNTEYSREEIGYVYHPGYDFFNNHIMRNKTFKIVNPPETRGNEDFNTIQDIQRRPDTSNVKFTGRIKSITDIPSDSDGAISKHLYDAEDILSFIDSINTNLTEENGWFGFINNSGIDAKKTDKITDLKDNEEEGSMGISRILNNKHRCEFIDMYPDRTLYSFVPKYNKYQKRLEYNWDVFLTYPYSTDRDHRLVKNGLRIAEIRKVSGFNGRDVLVVRTYTKHNISKGDTIYFYYSSDDAAFKRSSSAINVTNVGNLNGEDMEYYFYTTDVSLVLDALGSTYWYDETGNWLKSDTQINYAFNSMFFTLKRLYNGKESEYYFRKFRKLPNFKTSEQHLTEEISENKDKFEDFVKNNNLDINFSNEYYKLAFANTIYTDDTAQVSFTDDIDIENMTDHLKRPLSEIYVTILKTCKGHKEWYLDETFGGKDIEFSHCFNKSVSGIDFNMSSKKYCTNDWINKRKELGDITLLHPEENSEGEKVKGALEGSGKDDISDALVFYGDVVEFNAYDCREFVLDVVQHRFNTMQRDCGSQTYLSDDFFINEITSDDYDGKFIMTKSTSNDFKDAGDILYRPEGYYYKPHYRIPLKSFGPVKQDFHGELGIRLAQPRVTSQGMMIEVKTRLPHKMVAGDKFFICDPTDDEWIETTVFSELDSVTFMFSPFVENGDGYHPKLENWVRLCDIFNADMEDKRYKIRRRNPDIPNYATKVGQNSFIWREPLSVGDLDAVGLPDYVFANGRFYIYRPINLYLRRQDPHGENKLYAKDLTPNDVSGNRLTIDIQEYKEEEIAAC